MKGNEENPDENFAIFLAEYKQGLAGLPQLIESDASKLLRINAWARHAFGPNAETESIKTIVQVIGVIKFGQDEVLYLRQVRLLYKGREYVTDLTYSDAEKVKQKQIQEGVYAF